MVMEALGDDLAMLPMTIDEVNCSEPVGFPLLPIYLELLSFVVLRDGHEHDCVINWARLHREALRVCPIRFVILERSDIMIEVEAGSS